MALRAPLGSQTPSRLCSGSKTMTDVLDESFAAEELPGIDSGSDDGQEGFGATPVRQCLLFVRAVAKVAHARLAPRQQWARGWRSRRIHDLVQMIAVNSERTSR